MATKSKTKTGREQRRSTKTAIARAPDLSKFYRYRLPPIVPGDFTFHLDLLRPKLPPLSLDRTVETFSWDDQNAVLAGSIGAHRPDSEDPTSLPITRGMLVRCSVDWAQGRYGLWTMRTQAPQSEVDTGLVTVALQDDLARLDGGGQDWWFRKTKHRRFGYTSDEVAYAVGRTLGIKVRKVAKGTARFELKLRNATGLDVLRQAYQKEKAASGRSFVIRLRDGQLEIVPLARNPMLYVIADQIQTALITQKAGRKIPTTVLTGTGRIGNGSHTQKISYIEYDRQVVGLLGYVPDTMDFGRVASHADLRGQVQRELAKRLRVNDTVTVQHQGIPFIVRGDGVQLDLPSEGYKGADSFVFCTRATHTVAAGAYTTQWDFTLTDPFLAQLNADAKAAAARLGKTGNISNTLPGSRFLVVASAEDDPPGASGSCRTIQADGYSELSTIPMGTSSDFAALGHIPCLTPLRLTNPQTGQSTVTVKQDVGAGSSFLPVMGIYPATRSAIGFDNSGQYQVIIERVDGQPLTPVRGSRL